MPGISFRMDVSVLMITPQKKILVVDDEARLVSLVETYLTQNGYGVITASNGAEALSIAQREDPELIILDLMMPVMDGYEFMRAYRSKRDTPIIILTARVDSDDKLAGFELGADDYIIKPFRPRELMARVKAVLRRAGKIGPPAQVLHAADVTLDRENHQVRVGDRYVDLSPSEFELLSTLMTEPGRVFTRLDLLDILQGVRLQGIERAVDLQIKNLRAKIEPVPHAPRYIETVYGTGYRFARP